MTTFSPISLSLSLSLSLSFPISCDATRSRNYLKSSSARAVKIMQGRAKFPTKTLRPLASCGPMMPHRPLRYLRRQPVRGYYRTVNSNESKYVSCIPCLFSGCTDFYLALLCFILFFPTRSISLSSVVPIKIWLNKYYHFLSFRLYDSVPNLIGFDQLCPV